MGGKNSTPRTRVALRKWNLWSLRATTRRRRRCAGAKRRVRSCQRISDAERGGLCRCRRRVAGCRRLSVGHDRVEGACRDDAGYDDRGPKGRSSQKPSDCRSPGFGFTVPRRTLSRRGPVSRHLPPLYLSRDSRAHFSLLTLSVHKHAAASIRRKPNRLLYFDD